MFKIVKKEKIIVSIIVILLIGISYYIYSNQDTNDINKENNSIKDIEENVQEEQNTENKNIIVVHVSGAVNNDGIIELEEGSRVSDAIEKAGGLKENAYTKDINLAYKVEDEMKIYIPTIDERNKYSEENDKDAADNIITNKNFKNDSTNIKDKNSKININTATKEQLESLPGIGESTSIKIIEYRNQNGKFKDIQDIKNIKGIGESKFNNIKDKIDV